MGTQNCWQITGPPGCGKTTWLADKATKMAEEHTGKKIVVASLTRAAAYEFASRKLSMIPEDQIGTLHMICRRALGKPELTEGKHRDWAEFLDQNQGPERFALSGREGPKGLDRTGQSTDGDELLQSLTVLRNQQPGIFADGIPSGLLLTNSQHAFYDLWEAWKDEAQLMDFTDLLEQCLEVVDRAPGDPAVMFGDEVQDWSKLEVELFCDHWGQHAEDVFLVGDPDQAIYEWRGADPRIFLDRPVPKSQKILLDQSYRVSRAVRDCALRWIERKIQAREPVAYKSRLEDGFAGQVEASFRTPERLKDLVTAIHASDETAMILGSCDYMLRPTMARLREWGIPYSNPYRAGDKSWNPLRWGLPARGDKKAEVTKLDQVLAYLEPSVALRGVHNREWTWTDIQKWTEPLRSKDEEHGAAVMAHGAKADIAKFVKHQNKVGPYTMETFLSLFRGDHGSLAHKMDLDWWFAAMRSAERKKYAYFEAIIKNYGQRALVEKPRIWVGTIHSVKGGEADNVILFPDLSPAADKEYWGSRPDETVRLFYVAMTRARSDLICGSPSSPHHVEITRGMPLYQRLRPVEIEVPF